MFLISSLWFAVSSRSALLLASAAFASEGIDMRKEKHAVAASAAAPVSKNAHDCSFVSAGVFELLVPVQTSSSVCWSHQ